MVACVTVGKEQEVAPVAARPLRTALKAVPKFEQPTRQHQVLVLAGASLLREICRPFVEVERPL